MKSLRKEDNNDESWGETIGGIVRKRLFSNDITDKFPRNFPFKSHKKKITRAISFTPAVAPFSSFLL